MRLRRLHTGEYGQSPIDDMKAQSCLGQPHLQVPVSTPVHRATGGVAPLRQGQFELHDGGLCEPRPRNASDIRSAQDGMPKLSQSDVS